MKILRSLYSMDSQTVEQIPLLGTIMIHWELWRLERALEMYQDSCQQPFIITGCEQPTEEE
jgi:hypothetical protein